MMLFVIIPFLRPDGHAASGQSEIERKIERARRRKDEERGESESERGEIHYSLRSPPSLSNGLRVENEEERESERECTLEPRNKTCFCAAKFYKFRRRGAVVVVVKGRGRKEGRKDGRTHDKVMEKTAKAAAAVFGVVVFRTSLAAAAAVAVGAFGAADDERF